MSIFLNIFTKKIKSNYFKLENSSTPPTDSVNQIYTKSDIPYFLDTLGNEKKILSTNDVVIENKHVINSVETISTNTTLSSSNANIINIDNCVLTLPSATNLISFLIIGSGSVNNVEGLNIVINNEKLHVISNGSKWYII